jgi:hypothetical protein
VTGDVSRALSRVVLLLAWAVVLWGTLLLAATVLHAVTEGLSAALRALVPGRGASLWAWANLAATASAALAWSLAAAVVVRLRRSRQP